MAVPSERGKKLVLLVRHARSRTYIFTCDHHIRSSHSVHRVNGYNGEPFNAMLWSSAFTIRTDNCRIDGAWGLVIVNH